MAETKSKIDLIIDQLDKIHTTQQAHGEKLYDIHGRISKVEVKASIYGLIGGLISALLATFGLKH